MHEILREEVVKRLPPREFSILLAAAILGSLVCRTGPVVAEKGQKLSGDQIRAKFAGMQFTDEVHWRYVYDRDGRLRSYSMGTKKVGKWTVEKDELCLRGNG